MKIAIEVEGDGSATSEEKSEKKESRENQDRLSNLPDEVIYRILSFVDAASAVQTCVLSKRWRHLWSSLPVLNLNDTSFDHPSLFQCFIDHLFSTRDPSSNVCELNLVCQDELDDHDDPFIVDSIIDYVTLTPISTTIQLLTILAESVVVKLPQLSLCRSLTTLKLTDIATETATFDFVSLKHLYLSDCRFEWLVGEVFDPFRGCASLTCLCLHGCQFYGGIERFKICAPQLTDLSISHMRVDGVSDSDCVIELSTPKLRSFTYFDTDLYDFSIEGKLPFMEKLSIDLGTFELSHEFTRATELPLRLIELFEIMCSAKCVSLSPGIIEVLSMFPDLLDGRSSPFTRLRIFEVNMDRSPPFVIPTDVMAYLFGGSPGFHC
ncbi:hypothetical protein RJT34_12247 [Clitoria ternatea]|uniref:F-box domain-containing protein n=1 Tax=Clitoria ternatea TaxID=43366 RepID=A0AAN9PKR7_CLITE